MVISETWIKDNIVHLYSIPGYVLLSAPRQSSRGGGVAIYLHDKFSYIVRNDILSGKINHLEHVSIEVTMKKSSDNIVVISIYKPLKVAADSFNQSITDLLEYVTVKHKNKRIIVAGDINIDLIKSNFNPLYKQFFDIIIMYGFMPLIEFHK